MVFTFWNDEWREHTKQKGEQRGKIPCSTNSSQNDNAGKEGQN